MTPAQRATNLPCHADARRSLLGDGPSEPQRGRVDEGQEFDAQRYYYQGIGGFEADVEMAGGLAIASRSQTRPRGWLCAWRQTHIHRADIYGFVANICFVDIETPLKEFVEGLTQHCRAIYAAVGM
jgi:hypothetical protein